MADVYIVIIQGKRIMEVAVTGTVSWETNRKGEAGKLTFSALKTTELNFQEGDLVIMRVGNNDIFRGYVFTKKHSDKNIIEVTAYDQLRYLKNKDTILFEKMSASTIIKTIANKFIIDIGLIEETGYVIEYTLEDNKTLLDMIQNALGTTLDNTKKIYVLYDQCGKLTLKNIEKMKLNLLIDENDVESFSYSSSIDGETYNNIKLTYNNSETKKREIYIAKSGENINKWGLLQYYENVQSAQNIKQRADALLSLYNRKIRKLNVSGAYGNIEVRGGCSLIVKFELGDISIQNYMIVDSVKHIFEEGVHKMDLTFIGGEFSA